MSTALPIALRPLDHILADPATEDLAIQEPGVGWVYRAGGWHRVGLSHMTYQRLHGIAVMAAAQTRQKITPRAPILSADLPGNIRLEAVVFPAVPPGTVALTFRRGDTAVMDVEDVPRRFDTGRWNQWAKRDERRRAQDAALLDRYDAGDIVGFLRGLALTHQTGLFGGPTGSGKTTLSKMLGAVVPMHERIITLENARELVVLQPNNVRHFYSSSGDGATPAQLMKATKRERPHRVLLAEMLDAESTATFVDEVMAGHPGSISTIHGRTPGEAARRLFNLYKSSTAGRTMDDATVAAQLATAIDFIIPVENDAGLRSVGEVWFAADARRRGETFGDLLKSA